MSVLDPRVVSLCRGRKIPLNEPAISPIMKRLPHLRYPLLSGFAICAAAYIPLIYSGGKIGSAYWKYLFPAFVSHMLSRGRS